MAKALGVSIALWGVIICAAVKAAPLLDYHF
jgi:hypothetical protein